jgi:hypothetical protein
MKFDITPGSIDYPTMQTKLEAEFPDYSFKMRGKQFLVAKKSGTIGANIVIRKKRIQVAGNFPTMGGTMIFVLCILLLGVIIPFIIYLAAFQSKMKKLEKEIGSFLEKEYKLGAAEIV